MGRTIVYTANQSALTKTANLLSGDANEFVTEESDVSIYALSSATGIRLTIFADGDLIVDDKEIPYIGTTLDTSAHFFTSFSVAPGTRLSVFARETANAGTTDHYLAVDVE